MEIARLYGCEYDHEDGEHALHAEIDATVAHEVTSYAAITLIQSHTTRNGADDELCTRTTRSLMRAEHRDESGFARRPRVIHSLAH
jgi:hypothetical protein